MTPFDALFAGLKSSIDAELAPHVERIALVRELLSEYEAALRADAENAAAQKVAGALEIELPPVPELAGVRERLRLVLDQLRAALDTKVAPPPDPVAGPVVEVAPKSDPEPEPQSRPSALSQDEVRAWFAERVRSEASAPPVTGAELHHRHLQILRGLVERAGPPSPLATDADLVDELDRLDEISSQEELARWLSLSREQQRLWLSYLVARTRALKDRSHSNPTLKQRIRDVIVRYPTFAKDTRPGHVNGMRPDHEPVSMSWGHDARGLFEELRATVEGSRAEETPQARRSVTRPRTSPASEPRETLEWRYRDRAADMTVLMFGGNPREDARENIERSLGIGTLDWPESDKPRKVDALVDAIGRHKYDVVLVLARLVYHTESNKLVSAAKAAGVPFVLIESGYGVDAIRGAIESALDGIKTRASA